MAKILIRGTLSLPATVEVHEAMERIVKLLDYRHDIIDFAKSLGVPYRVQFQFADDASKLDGSGVYWVYLEIDDENLPLFEARFSDMEFEEWDDVAELGEPSTLESFPAADTA